MKSMTHPPLTELVAGEEAPQAVAVNALRIAIISDAAPARNGVGTYYVDLQKHLSSAVERIEMFSPTVLDDKWKAGLVFPLPGDHTQKLCFPNPIRMRNWLQALRPHVAIIATPGVYGLVGAFWTSRLGIPRLAGFHTSFEQITKLYWKQGSAPSRIIGGYFKVSNNYLLDKCPLVLANSEAMIEQAQRLGAQQTRLIGTTVSATFTHPPLVPYSGQLQRILFAGRLAPEKNLSALIDAARRQPERHFTVAGDGPERDRMQALARELPNLECLGWLERDQLREQIDAHDALILPSHFESFGTIALEAMARERIVVVSPHCGIAEWEAFNRGLYLVKGEDLAQTLADIGALSEEQRREHAHHAYSLTRELNQHSLGQWLTLFQELASPALETR